MERPFRVDSSRVEVSGRSVGVLQVVGSLDVSTVDVLEAACAAALREGSKHLVLGLAQMSFISTAGLLLLLKLNKRTQALGGSLRIAEPNREVREHVLDVFGFMLVLEVHGTLEEALQSIGKQEPEE